MKKQIKLLNSLLFSCKEMDNWEPVFFESKPYQNFVSSLLELDEVSEIGDLDLITASLNTQLDDSELQGNDDFGNALCQDIIENIIQDLESNIAPHWIIISLNKASLKKDKRSGNIRFITGDEDRKINKLASISGISLKQARTRANHTKKSRAPSFFDNPLLCIKIENQTSQVENIALKYTLWAISLLQVIYWGKIHPDKNHYRLFIPMSQHRKTEHIMIYAKDSWRFRHRTFNFYSDVRLELDWIQSYYYIRKYVEFFDEIVKETDNDLKFRILRAIRFFHKSLEFEHNRDTFEGVGMATTMLMIAAETLIFERSQEIKSKLSVVLPELCLPKNLTKVECAKSIKTTYEWRCDLVHSGNDTWKSNFDEADEKKKYYDNLKITVANLIYVACQFTADYNSNNNIEKSWFSEIQDIWEKRIGWK
jgi:hypothetical protein